MIATRDHVYAPSSIAPPKHDTPKDMVRHLTKGQTRLDNRYAGHSSVTFGGKGQIDGVATDDCVGPTGPRPAGTSFITANIAFIRYMIEFLEYHLHFHDMSPSCL
jgi:hypothetical protein